MNFSKNEKRIIKYLIEYGHQLNFDELLNKTNYSFSKLNEIVDIINEKIKNFGKIVFKNETIVINITDTKLMYHYIYNSKELGDSVSQNSRRKKLLLILITNFPRFIKIDYLSNQLCCSRRSVDNDIKILKQILGRYRLNIVGIPNKGIRIEGDEFNIRLLILHYVYDDYVDTYDVKISNDMLLRGKLDKILNNFSLNLSEMDLLNRSVTIAIIRCSLGYNLEKPTMFYQNKFKKSEQLINLKYYLTNNYAVFLSDEDFDFLCFPLNLENKKSINVTDDVYIDRILQRVRMEVHKRYGFFIDTNIFEKEIKSHLVFLINRIIFDYYNGVIVDDKKIASTYPFSYQVSVTAAKAIYKELNLCVPTNEIAYLTLYFQLVFQKKNNQKQKFGIIKCFGKSVMTMIKNKIISVFQEKCDFVELNESELKNLDSSDISAIFTAIPLKVKIDVPIIFIQNMIDNKYIMEEILKGKIRNIVNDQGIFFRFSKNECLKINYQVNVAARLTEIKKNKELDNDFINKIIKQDKQNINYGGAFIPHAILKNSQRFLLDISVFYNHNSFQVIFLIGMPKQMTRQQENFLLKIYDVIFESISQMNSNSVQRHNDDEVFLFDKGGENFWSTLKLFL